MHQIKAKNILLISVLVLCGLAVVFRLWHLSELFHFTYDEEVFAFVGKRLIVNHHIPLIGGVTPMHVHLAPYFYWFSSLILGLSNLNPLGWGYVAALVSFITMIALYVLAKQSFGFKVAMLTVILYGFSFYQNIFDRHYWGLMFDGLLTVASLFALVQISQGKQYFSYLLAIVLAFGFHTDPSTLTLFVLLGLTVIFDKVVIKPKTAFFAACLFLLSFLPLILFDLKHEGANSRGILQYISEVRSGRKGVVHTDPTSALLFLPTSLARTIYVFGNKDAAFQYAYCPLYSQGRLRAVPTWVSLGVLVILGVFIFFIRPKKPQETDLLKYCKRLLIALYIGIVMYGLLVKGDLFDHYLATFYPVWYIILAYLLIRYVKTWLITFLLGLFIFINLYSLSNASHIYGLHDKLAAVRWVIKASGASPFSLDSLGNCFKYNGYRYLFLYAGKEPAKSFVDANFTYLYDAPPQESHPDLLAVIVNPDFVEKETYAQEYAALQKHLLARQKFGEIEVLLVDNKDHLFVGKY